MRYVALVVFVLSIGGCGLSLAQSQALADLEARMLAYEPRIAAVVDQIEARQIPFEEGAALISQILSERDADLSAIEELKAQSVPWYYVAGSLLVNALQLFVLKRKSGVLAAVVKGVESAGSAKVKEEIAAVADKLHIGTVVDREVQKLVA